MKKILFAVLIAGCLAGMATEARADDCLTSLRTALDHPDLTTRLTVDALTIFWMLPEACDKNQWDVNATIGITNASCQYREENRVECTFSRHSAIFPSSGEASSEMTEDQRQAIYREEMDLIVSNVNTAIVRRSGSVRIGSFFPEPGVDAPTSRIMDINANDLVLRPGFPRNSELFGRVATRLADIAIDDEAEKKQENPIVDETADDTTKTQPSARINPPPVVNNIPQGFLVDGGDGCTMIPGTAANPGMLLWLVSLLPLAIRRRG